MPRGGFGRSFGGGFGGRGFGMRRIGMPLIYPMGGGGMGSPLLTTLLAGGLGYMMGNTAQQAVPPSPAYPSQYPYPGTPVTPGSAVSTYNSRLAQLELLGKLHVSGVLTDDEFEREKQQILHC